MHNVYANLIELGLRELKNVPSPWKKETEEELKKRNWEGLNG